MSKDIPSGPALRVVRRTILLARAALRSADPLKAAPAEAGMRARNGIELALSDAALHMNSACDTIKVDTRTTLLDALREELQLAWLKKAPIAAAAELVPASARHYVRPSPDLTTDSHRLKTDKSLAYTLLQL